MTPDHELLRRYTDQNDEAAFAEIVRRHLNLVYACATRLLNNDAALAQDVTQTVFTDLARKATRLRKHPTVAGWLHTSARFAASKVVRAEHSRRTREQEASTMHETTTPADTCWAQLRPELDEAVGQLREADRDALLLRYFEEKSHREIGEVLGVSERAAQMRVERALEKLRGKFSRRGVATTAALLATTLGAHGASTVAPIILAETVLKKSLADAVNPESGTPVPPWASTLAKLTIWRIALMAVGTGLLLFIFTRSPHTTAVETPPKTASIKVAVAAPTLPARPASNKISEIPAKNNLGKIKLDDDTAPVDDNDLQTFTLASGRLFKIMGNVNSNGTADIIYGVSTPDKASQLLPHFKDKAALMEINVAYMDSVMLSTPISLTTSDGESFSFIPSAQPLALNYLGEVNVSDGVPHAFPLHSGKVFVLTLKKSPGDDRATAVRYMWYDVYDSTDAYKAKIGPFEGGGLGGLPKAGEEMDMPLNHSHEAVIFSLHY